MKEWLIIDGYNLIHQLFADNPQGDLAFLRKTLLSRLEPLVNILAKKITVVFDGRSESGTDKPMESEIIEVIYAPPASSADSVIENLVWKAERPENILVVTSDRLERTAASAGGAETMASSIFISMLEDEQSRLGAKIKQMNKKEGNITLDSFFPKQETD
jgi:predicted RNA-binding protein with PIN domain